MIEQDDTTRPAVDSSEPSEAVKVSFQDLRSYNQTLHHCTVSSLNC